MSDREPMKPNLVQWREPTEPKVAGKALMAECSRCGGPTLVYDAIRDMWVCVGWCAPTVEETHRAHMMRGIANERATIRSPLRGGFSYSPYNYLL